MGKKKKKGKSLFGLGEIAQPLETEHNLKNSAIETTKDVLVGALGGGVVGAAIGRASLAVGAAITGLSHYYKSTLGKVFGIGVMASGGFTKSDKSVNGTDDKKPDLIEEAKERVMSFKEELKKKLYLDKLLKDKKSVSEDKKQESKSTSSSDTKEKDDTEKPVGEVLHFVYPHAKVQDADSTFRKQANLNVSGLDEIEESLHKSASEFLKNQGTEGLGDTELDPSEKNY